MKKSYLSVFFLALLAPNISYAFNGSKTYSNGTSYDISIDIENKEYCVFVGGQEGCSDLYVTENNSSNIKFHTSPYFNPTCKHSFDGKYLEGLISGNFSNPNCADTSSGSWSVNVPYIQENVVLNENVEIIFNKLEELYSKFIYPHKSTSVKGDDFIRSYIDSPVSYVSISQSEPNDIRYYHNNKLNYFNTLSGANSKLCNNTCFNSILENSEMEKRSPTMVSPNNGVATKISLKKDHNYFKFEVEPGYYYSFIVNTNSTQHIIGSKGAPYLVDNSGYQSLVNGVPKPNYGRGGEDSPAKSAIMFYADPSYFSGKYINYINVYAWDDIPISYIKLIKKSNKKFGLPMSGLHSYYNSFGHRAKLEKSNGGTFITNSGHNAIDMTAYKSISDFSVDFDRSIVPVADGTVAHKVSWGGDLGQIVWIHHTLDGKEYTSLYAHLKDLQVSIGDNVIKGKTKLGSIDLRTKHVHLEMFKKHSYAWKLGTWGSGYSYGGQGQVDPLSLIFEE